MKVKKATIDKYIRACRDFFHKHKIESSELVIMAQEIFGCTSWHNQLIDVLVLMRKNNETIYKVLELVGLKIEEELEK